MGWFSSETITSVGSATVPIVQDTSEELITSVLFAVFQNQNIAETVVDSAFRGLGSKYANYYNFGVNGYSEGLPRSDIEEFVDKRADMLTILQTKENAEVDIEFFDVSTPNSEFWSFEYLNRVADYGNGSYGQIPDYKSKFVENADTFYYSSRFIDNTTLEITYSVAGTDTKFTETVTEIVLLDRLYYKVTYKVKTENTYKNRWFKYRIGEGIYPELDDYEKGEELTVPFYPIVMLRQNSKFIDENSGEKYFSSIQLLKKFNVDMENIIDAIKESPDLDSLDHAYFYPSLHIPDGVNFEAEYGYTFFHQLNKHRFPYNHSNNSTPVYHRLDEHSYVEINYNTFTISQGSFRFSYYFYYIKEDTNIALPDSLIDSPVGTHATKLISKDRINFSHNIFKLQDVPNPNFNPSEPEDANNPKKIKKRVHVATITANYEPYDSGVIFYKKTSENRCSKIFVAGLSSHNRVYSTSKCAIDAIGRDNVDFVLPLSFTTLNEMNLNARNHVMYRSCNLIFNAYERTKLKWYETVFGTFLVFAVVVVVSSITGQIDAGMAAISAAIAAGAEATATLIASYMLASLIVRETFSFISRELGVEFSFLVAVIALAAGIFLDPSSGIAITSLFVNAVEGVTLDIDRRKKTIENEFEEFNEFKTSQEEILDEKIKEFEDNINIADPLGIYPRFGINPNEAFSTMYNRVYGSIGLELQQPYFVSNFVDASLQLPITPNEGLYV